MKFLLNLVILSAVTVLNIAGGRYCFADSKNFIATIHGKNEVIITKASIRLSDIAEINANDSSTQLQIAKIEIASSPKPGSTLEITAQSILNKLQNERADFQQIGYALAPLTKVKRASRTISEAEIEDALQAVISKENSDFSIKEITMPKDSQIFTGPITIQAALRSALNQRQQPFEITLSNLEGEKMTLAGRVEIDSWKEVPIASRAITPGSLVEALDFGLARLNSKDLPKDAALDPSEIIGKRINREISSGEVFRAKTLERPSLIKAGAKVSVITRVGHLEASASGIAMQDGFEGDLIEVRNDSSKKIIQGKIKDQSTVEILQ